MFYVCKCSHLLCCLPCFRISASIKNLRLAQQILAIRLISFVLHPGNYHKHVKKKEVNYIQNLFIYLLVMKRYGLLYWLTFLLQPYTYFLRKEGPVTHACERAYDIGETEAVKDVY